MSPGCCAATRFHAMISLDTVTHADFEACLHETFDLLLVDGTFPLKLTALRKLGSPAPGAKRDPFALTFQSAKPIRLPQGTYQLKNDHIGEMEIFLVQHEPTEVEAIFS
jgi:hypothetical protein